MRFFRQTNPPPLPPTTACARGPKARAATCRRHSLTSLGGDWSYSTAGNNLSHRLASMSCSSMARAARLPNAMALETFDAPVTRSPPAKNRGRLVSRL